jgi:hypothetical protein
MFGWFKRKPNPEPLEPRLSEAYRLLCQAHKLLENAGYVMQDTKDWGRLPDARLRDQAAQFYARAETQTRFLKEHILIVLNAMPGVKVTRKGAK